MRNVKDFVQATVDRLHSLDMPIAQIARDADVNESWLRMFMGGNITNPGVRQFERVRAYLERQDRAA